MYYTQHFNNDKQHSAQPMIAFMTSLLSGLSLEVIFLHVPVIICKNETIVTIKEPYAIEPKWYLKHHHNPS